MGVFLRIAFASKSQMTSQATFITYAIPPSLNDCHSNAHGNLWDCNGLELCTRRISWFFAFSRFSFPGNPSNVHIANVFQFWYIYIYIYCGRIKSQLTFSYDALYIHACMYWKFKHFHHIIIRKYPVIQFKFMRMENGKGRRLLLF